MKNINLPSTMNLAIIILVLISIVFVLGETDAEWRKKALDRHNFYRANHGVPLLKQSDELCNISQIHANHLRDTNAFNHSTGYFRNDTGENILKAGDFQPDKTVDIFYNEIHSYDFDKGWAKLGRTFHDIGHFTQLIWKETSEVCVSYAKPKNGTQSPGAIVANYRPAGNLKGTYLRNVFRKIETEGTASQKVENIFKLSICLALTHYLFYPFG